MHRNRRSFRRSAFDPNNIYEIRTSKTGRGKSLNFEEGVGGVGGWARSLKGGQIIWDLAGGGANPWGGAKSL